MPRTKREDKTEIARRCRVVEGMLHRCLTHGSIQAMLSKEWGITPRQIRNYIRKVYDKWEADAKALQVDRVEQRRNQFEGLLETAMKANPPDVRSAAIILDRLCKIDGAYAAVKVVADHTGSIGYSIRDMTSDDKRRKLEDLMLKANVNRRGEVETQRTEH